MSKKLDRKYRAIQAGERALAKRVAVQVIRSKPLTVWDVTLPPVLIFTLLRLKSAREMLARNFLFTKQLALDAALSIAREDQARSDARAGVKARTDEVLASDSRGIYSHKIRQAQMREVDLLMDHYAGLLQTDGKDHEGMVRRAYDSKGSYLKFLDQLVEREADVKRAAMETLGEDDSPEIVSKMESALEQIRTATADRIFGSPQPPP